MWRTTDRCIEAALSAMRCANGHSGSDGVHEPASQSIRTAVSRRSPAPASASKVTTEPSERSPAWYSNSSSTRRFHVKVPWVSAAT